MISKSVLCDTSFFIRLLDSSDKLHHNARQYFRYFAEQNYGLCISTIAIAEYCVRGRAEELPLRNFKIVPFNLDHAKQTGELALLVFEKKDRLNLSNRNIIPNDTKMFAQADVENGIGFYLSSDSESLKIYRLLKEEGKLDFQFIDLHNPYSEVFGLLGL